MAMTTLPQSKALSSSLFLLFALLLGDFSTSLAFQTPATTTHRNVAVEVAGASRQPLSLISSPKILSSHCSTTASARKSFRIQRKSNTILSSMGASTSSTISDDIEAYEHKSILLTGASRGLGKSLARALSKCNPSLLILSGRDEGALKEVQRECLQIAKEQSNDSSASDSGTSSSSSSSSMQVEIVTCDLGDKSSVEQLATTSLELAQKQCASGVVDILILNGGISSRSSFLESSLEVDEKLMQVNFFSGALLAKRLVPGMVESKGGGKVIWTSSVQGKLGTPYRTSYAASKFAVQGYCEALRSELASSNVSVHVVSPGYIRTNLSLSAVMGDGRAYSKMDETTANGADPDEVAATILNSVTAGESDFVVAATLSAKAGIWLKFLAPSFLESMLVKRFEKQKLESKKNE